jgi:hypothetical protein
MKRFLVLFLAVFMVVGMASVASAALTFDLDFGQDGTYENQCELRPSDVVYIDLYVSGIPSGEPIYNYQNDVWIKGLLSMGIDITYDPNAVEINPGTEFRMDPMSGRVNTDTSGHIYMTGSDMSTFVEGRDGLYGDDILVGTIEFHCIAPTGITELWLYDKDHGGPVDDWALLDGTVLDGDIIDGIKLGEINQVPIPGAALLLGSGLLGLVGIKRRFRL